MIRQNSDRDGVSYKQAYYIFTLQGQSCIQWKFHRVFKVCAFRCTMINRETTKVIFFKCNALPINWSHKSYTPQICGWSSIREKLTMRKYSAMQSLSTPSILLPFNLPDHITLFLPHKVKMQHLHFRSHPEYFLLSWKIPEVISRRSILFHN